jgi:hypothetical protein
MLSVLGLPGRNRRRAVTALTVKPLFGRRLDDFVEHSTPSMP